MTTESEVAMLREELVLSKKESTILRNYIRSLHDAMNGICAAMENVVLALPDAEKPNLSKYKVPPLK